MDDYLREAGPLEQIEKIEFYDEELDGFVEFFIVERTRINGTEYLLATQELNQDADAYIFRVADTNTEEGADLLLELVEDETELESIGKVFAELVSDDVEIKM